MTTTTYLYRHGDGNEGNYPRFLIELSDDDNPYAALEALVINEYTLGPVRQHIEREISSDGKAEYGISAHVLEGPNGEQAFEAAWLTAEFEVLTPKDLEYTKIRHATYTLAEVLDAEAMAWYRRACDGEGETDSTTVTIHDNEETIASMHHVVRGLTERIGAMQADLEGRNERIAGLQKSLGETLGHLLNAQADKRALYDAIQLALSGMPVDDPRRLQISTIVTKTKVRA